MPSLELAGIQRLANKAILVVKLGYQIVNNALSLGSFPGITHSGFVNLRMVRSFGKLLRASPD
jgi:hypothetical protein